MAFEDHFSDTGEAYRRFRPGYPEELFAFLTSVAPAGGRVWECGAGSGQATTGLARAFTRLLVTDPSHAQLRLADARLGRRIVCTAEAAPLPPGSVDLVVVAQALHWIAHDPFFAEVRRVARPGGALAVWTYGLPEPGGELDAELASFARGTMGPFWPPGRRHVEEAYRSIDFPFEELVAPELAMTAALDRASFFGYVRTWSAVRRARAASGADPVDALEQAWSGRWPADEARRVRWPLTLRTFRVR